jgi:predicted transcriptional regulator
MVNPFEHATDEQYRIHEAVRRFAQAIGCDMTEEGGKEFARVVMVAIAEAAFERGDIFESVARRLIALRRPNPSDSLQ